MSDHIPVTTGQQLGRRSWAEPWKIKMVVYTQAHMDVTAEAVEAVYAAREQARGLRMTYEPKYLRFFQARFEPL